MAHRSQFLKAALGALLALATAAPAFAGYAQAKAAEGWLIHNGESLYKPVGPMPTRAANGTMTAANGTKFGPGGIRGTTTVPVGAAAGGTRIGYAMKFAAGAGTAAATILARNPALLLAATAAPYILEWINQGNPDKYDIRNGKIYEKSEGGDPEGCLQQIVTQGCFLPGHIASLYPGEFYCVSGSGATCPAGTSYYTVRGRNTNPSPTPDVVVSPGDFPSKFGDKPITPPLPFILPEPLPVDPPVINPTPAPVEEPWPSPSPQPQPLRIPQSDPVPIPNTEPQKYRQPWIELKPSQTPDPQTHWRMDARPIETETTSPTPVPAPVPVPPPSTDPQTPPPEGAGPSTDQDNPDFCALHPTAIACLEKGDPGRLEPVPLFNENKDISAINKVNGFGPSSGSCPPGHMLHVGGMSVEVGYSTICEFATMVNPLVIGFAWLSAAFTFFGFARRD